MSGELGGRSEDVLIARLRERLHDVPDARLLVGIGDDAAVWQPSRGSRSVITTDALVEGVHFTRDAMSARDAGHRALASNLSDVAAMGARPVLATVALGFPAETEAAWLLEAYDGIAALANRSRCAVAGGDLTRAPAIVFAIAVVGEVRASNLKTRAGARPGDVVAVTGPLGASRAGLLLATDRADLAAEPEFAHVLAAYRTPEPRLREGRWLGASRHVRAMMDTSDGLSTDLARLCAASGAGATVETVPVHPGARRVAARTGDDPDRWALDGGEDFELLVAVEKRAFGYLAARFRAHTRRELLRVGTITAEAGVRLADGSPVAPAGWDHLR
ncbi:MAG TPA: thiamine-phosphate kinase [Candidatus Elarobacter sp.]|jgi:thiamine-monophosphate kinase